MSKPISSAPVKIWPIPWKGCCVRRTAPPSQASLARMRCRRVWARDHSSSTWASTRSSGVPATVVCRGLHSDPALAQAFGRLRLLQLAAGELPVELGIHERHHVDPIDDEAAEEQVMAVDVESAHINAAHRDTADIAASEGGAPEARVDEGRAFEL